ncbi:HAD family hydrolase [Caproiciproducens sp. NJN-50]|uniref:HAD-IC family P-type ATPase n=1 Tax=Acutalibacteraceae TaxID=3082771 RepID=UPI000FFE2E2F|nr:MULTISPECIES: HAD-IC family P-type ATPase [Acutalibacteraceae]QAT50357.1 HAD family hydrolase [Caproiciproducens sp. NJN-50]
MMENTNSYCERFHPDYSSGLNSEQIKARQNQGLANGREESGTRTTGQIVRSNLVTPFNILNLILASLIIMVGSYKNLLFLGVIVCNTLIGTIQEIRAKKMIDRLSLITAPKAHVIRNGKESEVPVSELVLDDVMLLSTGNQVCADCVILNGECETDESLITGESDPVPKRSGDSLFSGSFLVGGSCRAQAEHIGEDNYASKIAASARYLKKPNSEIMTWMNRIIKITGFAILPIGILMFYKQMTVSGQALRPAVVSTVAALIGMIPEGLVLLTSVVLAVGILRLSRHKALVQELYSIETLAHVDTLCLDKTGTLTQGTLQAEAVVPLCDIPRERAEEALSALAAAMDDHSPTMNAIREIMPQPPEWTCESNVSFSSARKWSGACFKDKGSFVLGAGQFVLKDRFEDVRPQVEKYAGRGKRVLLLAHSDKPLGDRELPEGLKPLLLVLLSDRIRPGVRETLAYFADQGVELKVISGDDVHTAASIAEKAGLKNADRCVDASSLKSEEEVKEAAEAYTVFGRVTPDQKLNLIRALKEKKHTVAMTGDGVNDVPALKESDCSIAMASGSDAARTVSQIVLMDSDFSSMPRIVAEGRRCINNLQRSASLFLVKAIFSAVIAVLFLFLTCAYPFQPIQFTLINAVSIGIPSFFLALEPNRDRLRGSFIGNVMQKSVPGAAAMTLNIVLLVALSSFLGFSRAEQSTLAVLITGFTGLLILFKICFPFNTARVILFLTMAVLFVLALVFFPSLFEVTVPTIPMLLMLVPMFLFAASAMAVIYHLIERIFLRK